MTGGSVSRRTVTVNMHSSTRWQLSSTRHVTVVTPSGNALPEGETPIISVREAANRCAALYPNLQGNIRPQLAYYAPSLLLPAVQKILPCYICAGDASVDGQRVSLLQSIIPASEDPALTPSVALEASAQGSLVSAKATPAGGTPPYTYQWR